MEDKGVTFLGITWVPQLVAVSQLKKWDKNPRTISEGAYGRLRQRVLEEGMHQVLTIDQDGTVLSGNQRLQILTEMGVGEVWCMVPQRALTEPERNKIALESNIHDGKWDFEMLKTFDTPLLFDVGFTKLQLGEEKIANPEEADTRQVIDCPHCQGQIRLSNRVKKIEKVDKDVEN